MTPERRVLILYPLKFFLVFSGGIKWRQVVPVSLLLSLNNFTSFPSVSIFEFEFLLAGLEINKKEHWYKMNLTIFNYNF